MTISVTIPVTWENGACFAPDESIPDVPSQNVVITWMPEDVTITGITGLPAPLKPSRVSGSASWSVSYIAPVDPSTWSYTINGTSPTGIVFRHDPKIHNTTPTPIWKPKAKKAAKKAKSPVKKAASSKSRKAAPAKKAAAKKAAPTKKAAKKAAPARKAAKKAPAKKAPAKKAPARKAPAKKAAKKAPARKTTARRKGR